MWQKGESTEMKMDTERAVYEILKQDNITGEEEQVENRLQITKPK